MIFLPVFFVHRSARKENKKASYQMEIIPATDVPCFPRELPQRLALAVRFQLLDTPYGWDDAGKAA